MVLRRWFDRAKWNWRVSVFYFKHLVAIALWLSVVVVAIDGSFVVYVIWRRIWRKRYYAKKDLARGRFAPVVDRYAAGDLSVEKALALLECCRRRPEREALQELLLAAIAKDNVTRLTDLLVQLRYVSAWAMHVFGRRRAAELLDHVCRGVPLPPRRRRYGWPAAVRNLRVVAVRRAIAARYFTYLSDDFVRVLASEALHDGSSEVRRVSIQALGRSRFEHSLTFLLAELRDAIVGRSAISIRTVRNSVARYTVSDLGEFLPFLADTEPRVRFAMVDAIREIFAQSGNPPLAGAEVSADLRRALMSLCEDGSPDVRARAAGVVASFQDTATVAALRKLLEDDNQFVRLHAIRAASRPCYRELLPHILRLVTDKSWRVREAAVHSLAGLGSEGLERLAEVFLSTSDRYAAEQIADELQRSGALAQMAKAMVGREVEVVRQLGAKMVALERTAALAHILLTAESQPLRVVLLDVLAGVPTPSQPTLSALERITQQEGDPLQGRSRAVLATRAAAAGGRA